MVAKRVDTETIPQSRSDTLSEVALRSIANNVLRHGSLDATKKHIVYGEYSVGSMGTVYHNGHLVGLIINWTKGDRKHYGMV